MTMGTTHAGDRGAATAGDPGPAPRGELPVGELVRRLGLSQPLMSKHLRVLKDAGLVEVRADAQRRLYRIRPEPLAEIDHWLAPYRELWSTSLDRLERHLDSRRNA